MNIIPKKPLILAHRGASTQAPENTMSAFELALRQQADGIELDVHLSADGIPVVTHDEDMRRVAGEPGQVGETTLPELKKKNFAWYRPKSGFHTIPTLEEVLDLFRLTGLLINIELKNNKIDYPGLLPEVVRLTVRHRVQANVLLSSFNHRSIADACRLVSDQHLPIRCGLLYSRRLSCPWELAREIGADAIHPKHSLAGNPKDVESAHRAGVLVHVWTVDDQEDLEKFMNSGVDAIITNVPDLACSIRSRSSWSGRKKGYLR